VQSVQSRTTTGKKSTVNKVLFRFSGGACGRTPSNRFMRGCSIGRIIVHLTWGTPLETHFGLMTAISPQQQANAELRPRALKDRREPDRQTDREGDRHGDKQRERGARGEREDDGEKCWGSMVVGCCTLTRALPGHCLWRYAWPILRLGPLFAPHRTALVAVQTPDDLPSANRLTPFDRTDGQPPRKECEC